MWGSKDMCVRYCIVVAFCFVIALQLGCRLGIPDQVWNSESAHAVAAREADEPQPAEKNPADNDESDDNTPAPHPDDRVAETEADKLPRGYRPYIEWTMNEAATDSLVRLGPAALPRLEIELGSGDVEQRRRAAAAIARIGPDAAQSADTLELLVSTLADEDQDVLVRKYCLRALGQIGPAIWPQEPFAYRPATTLATTPLSNRVPIPVDESGVEIFDESLLSPGGVQSSRIDYEDGESARFKAYQATLRDYERRREAAQQAVDLLATMAGLDAGDSISLAQE